MSAAGRPAQPRSALIVPVRLPATLGALREAHEPMARLGVPAHVTILFPFLHVPAITGAVRRDVATLVRRWHRFTAHLDSVARRDDMVWLVPAEQAAFAALTEAVVERWPDHPPYGGIHDELVFHLTLAQSPVEADLDRVADGARQAAPIVASVDELQLIAEDGSGRWGVDDRWQLPGHGTHG